MCQESVFSDTCTITHGTSGIMFRYLLCIDYFNLFSCPSQIYYSGQLTNEKNNIKDKNNIRKIKTIQKIMQPNS